MTGIGLVVATDMAGAIGRQGELPWHLPSELRYFQRLTRGHVVVMGSRTHESILRRLGRPLPGRLSVVVSRQWPSTVLPGVVPAREPADALTIGRSIAEFHHDRLVLVIGGAQVYRQALPAVDTVYHTLVRTRVSDADAVMPVGWLDGFRLIQRSADIQQVGDQYAYSTRVLQREGVYR